MELYLLDNIVLYLRIVLITWYYINMVLYLQMLGVVSSASDAEIKAVYYKLSLKLHPDKNPDQSTEDAEMFTKINLVTPRLPL